MREGLERRLALGAGAALLIAFCAVSFVQARKLDYDFKHFFWDAEYVWRHATLNPDTSGPDRDARRQLPFYLPVVPLALAPLGALGPTGAAAVWTLAQAAALLACMRLLRSEFAQTRSHASAPLNAVAACDPQPSSAALVLALVLGLPALYELARFNQLSLFVLALVLAGGKALERDADKRAGALFALAALLKLLPGMFLVWLALKRRWIAAGSFALTAAVVELTPCLVFFGPQRTWQFHNEWWDYNMRGAAAKGMLDATLREHFIDHRNQSIPAVIARLCWPEHPHRAPWQLAALDEATCRGVALVAGGASLAALAWLTRRPARVLAPGALRTELALYALAMLILSPLVRQYYLVWALPALRLLAGAALDAAGGATLRRWGLAGLVIWLLGMLAWTSPSARLYGVHLGMLIALAVCLVGSYRESGSRAEETGQRPVQHEETGPT